MANQTDSIKSKQVRVNIEQTILDAFNALCEKQGDSMSARARKLIIADLLKNEMLPYETLARLMIA